MSRKLSLVFLALAACSAGDAPTASTADPQVSASSVEATASVSVTASASAAGVQSAFTPPTLSGALSQSASAVAPVAVVALPPPPCPADMVLVKRVCVDRYEAYLKEILPTGELKTHPWYERPVKGTKYVAANELGAYPQGYISRVESKAACTEAGKRLCTRGEWTRACRGKGWMAYPYATLGKENTCNSGKLHLLSKMYKNPAGGYKYEDHFNSPELNKTAGFLAKAGEYTGCVSDLGVSDMVGNLHEWVEGTVDEALVEELESQDVSRRKQPWQTGNGIFMGGFYSTRSEHGSGCHFITIAHEPAYHDYSTGFRCCKNADLPKPEPKKKKPVTKKK